MQGINSLLDISGLSKIGNDLSSVDRPRDQKTISLCKTLNFLPLKGSKGYLCPGTNILGKIYNADATFGTSDQSWVRYSIDIFR